MTELFLNKAYRLTAYSFTRNEIHHRYFYWDFVTSLLNTILDLFIYTLFYVDIYNKKHKT